jgi:hypothetical protein
MGFAVSSLIQALQSLMLRTPVVQTKTCQICASRDFNGGIGLAQMMGNTNYTALVGGGKSPKFAMNKVSSLRA